MFAAFKERISMIFTSLEFLGFFVALLGALSIFRSTKSRIVLLIAASYVFYGAWDPAYLLLIFLCTLSGWGFGILMAGAPSHSKKRLYLWLSIIFSLSMLGYFKYANFFAENVATALDVQWRPAEIVLPVGISFFTFQTMSYSIDLYRGKIPLCRNFSKFMLFVAFFPQLVAGPIVRASEFLPQLERAIRFNYRNFVAGFQIFLGGAVQKVLIADNLSMFVDPVFREPNLYSADTLWLALLGYSVQIFCDFSGYSLMAIGIARVLGFQLPENFRMPYVSLSITEFWRRWHITLSSWLRDYLYISLGGNRRGEVQTKVNLMITMLLGGLWHGASWNFVLWGGLHGLGLAVHKAWSGWEHPLKTTFAYKATAWMATFGFVILLWVPFRSPDFATTLLYYRRLFVHDDGISWMHTASCIILALVAVWHVLYKLNWSWLLQFPARDPFALDRLYPILVTLMLILLFAPINTSPFIYFQF